MCAACSAALMWADQSLLLSVCLCDELRDEAGSYREKHQMITVFLSLSHNLKRRCCPEVMEKLKTSKYHNTDKHQVSGEL